MEEQKQTVLQPKKRKSPIELPSIDAPTKAETNAKAKKAEDAKKVVKAPVKKETVKTPTKKAAATKKEPTKSTAKATKKADSTKAKTAPKPKIKVESIKSTQIDPRTGKLKEAKKKEKVEKVVETKPVVEEKKTQKPKKRPTIKSKDVTIEPAPRDNTPKEIVRPTPKKVHKWTKEEKVLYKQLEESFNTVANMTWVIEERTMDTKNIPDLTLGELHVIEMVNRYNNKPMTLIAKKLHVTVGSLTIGVNRLVQKGYLLRIRDEMDRRVILLSVTQQGKKVLKFHDKFHDDILGLVLDTLTIQQAAKVMAQFASVLEMYYDPSIVEVAEKKTKKK